MSTSDYINKITCCDCREGLKLLDDNSAHSIVTDPPYEYGFMNKKWDRTGIAYDVEMWRECLRVLKPGGYLLSFGGTRTSHRMACAIEDAGFEIRDSIQEFFEINPAAEAFLDSLTQEQFETFWRILDAYGLAGQMAWIYASGFPKSLDISKAIDKAAGAEREIVGKRKVTPSDLGQSSGWNHLDTSKGVYNYTIPSTAAAKQWDGWGTALKPANEPICVARKPLDGTVVENVLKWGTGGINIDACRVGGEERQNPQAGYIRRGRTDEEVFMGTDKNKPEGTVTVTGRFPANVIFDEEAAAELDRQSGVLKSGSLTAEQQINGSFKGAKNCYGTAKRGGANEYKANTGCASRFFYVAKASRSERDVGFKDSRPQFKHGSTLRDVENADKKSNFHPCVKPLKLMEYLITLVTPKGGICLDPFEGSGTHQRACIELGFNYIGFEIDPSYCEIAEKRAKNVQLRFM